MYGKGAGYNIFAGKDASRGLGKSSLKPEDAVADYSTLDQSEMGVLEDWLKVSCRTPFDTESCASSLGLCVRLAFWLFLQYFKKVSKVLAMARCSRCRSSADPNLLACAAVQHCRKSG